MKNILFVCTGNTCRSPMAEYILRDKVNDQLQVKSAGISAFPGSAAAALVEQLLAERQVKVEHHSQQVDDTLMEWADLILTMTTGHKELLLQHYPHKADYVFTLKEYVDPESYSYDIIDPFGGSREVYLETMKELEQLLDKLIHKLKAEE